MRLPVPAVWWMPEESHADRVLLLINVLVLYAVVKPDVVYTCLLEIPYIGQNFESV